MSGNTVAFDVTAALEHDLFAADQTDFSGFLISPDQSISGIAFCDHTDPVNAPVLSIEDTTLIVLSSFEAVPRPGAVVLLWETAAEIDNAGFNLYRAGVGDYEQINAELIPAEGSPAGGAAYRFVDTEVRSGWPYLYRLEDVDLDGSPTPHAPVRVRPRRISR